ncbi:MAG: hypothetical protein OEW48_12105 [Phycisphaerae bacterium]|nr:hypothetical protein [Phycisphaerae bacterium]
MIKKAKILAILFVALALCTTSLRAAKIIYVDDDAIPPGDGTTWETAFAYLQDALMVASSGHEIRVAQGIYRPGDFVLSARPNLGREETFQLKSGVAVKGGYAGVGESNPNDRDIELYETILSGDLDVNDVEVNDPCDLLTEPTRADNCYHVVSSNNCDPNAVLDGVTITGGNANGTFPNKFAFGGGIYNYQSKPTMANCTFVSNSAGWLGGGMYNSEGSPALTNCTFIGNLAGMHGGGLFNGISSSPAVTNCTFSGNLSGGFGGGMINHSSPTVTNCTFSGNWAGWYGAGMCNFQGNPTVTNCGFTGNQAEYGGGGMRNDQSSPTVTNCTFSGNLSSGNGGGMANDSNSNPTVTNCAFTNNTGYTGAGITNWKSSPTITNCRFIGNTAESGGAMFNSEGSSPIVMNCTFSGNSALGPHNFGGQGGGILNYLYCSPTFTNSTFSSNSANYGGGIYSWFYSTLTVTNCTFTGNSAGLYGGGIYNTFNSTLTNCTFTGNSVGLDGGGMYNYYVTSIVTNCILWGNYAHNHGPQIAIGGLSYEQYTVNISYSNVQGGQAAVYDPCEMLVWEAGNIDADPCFADLGYWDPNGTPADANDDFFVPGDYHLKSEGRRYNPTTQSWIYDDVTSPCIDAGNPMFPIGLEPFPNGGIINMGAYGGTTEASKSYFGKPPCETIVAGDVNGDCLVNFLDFRLMALHWCEDNNP